MELLADLWSGLKAPLWSNPVLPRCAKVGFFGHRMSQYLSNVHINIRRQQAMYFSLGGLIMDVVNAEQAKIAEEAGACAVMALERVPADIRKDGGVARMSDPKLIKEIMAAVTIPVFAKVFILKDVTR